MIVVTGCRRSGTSLWMQMLAAAGLPIVGEPFAAELEALKDANPQGFFESEHRYGVQGDPGELRGQVVKMFVPGVVETGEDTIHAQKLVSNSDPILQGHFPGNPILPGVVQVEAMAQAAVVLASQLGVFDPKTQVCYFMGINEAKFRAPVRPGEVLDISVKALRTGRIGKFEGEVKAGDVVKSSAKFTAIIEALPTDDG